MKYIVFIFLVSPLLAWNWGDPVYGVGKETVPIQADGNAYLDTVYLDSGTFSQTVNGAENAVVSIDLAKEGRMHEGFPLLLIHAKDSTGAGDSMAVDLLFEWCFDGGRHCPSYKSYTYPDSVLQDSVYTLPADSGNLAVVLRAPTGADKVNITLRERSGESATGQLLLYIFKKVVGW